jgi:hypothetical protein
MRLDRIDPAKLNRFLIKNWMTHDALWYAEVAGKWGMAEASPMNLRVCRKLGQIEVKRMMKMLEASPPTNMQTYKNLFEIGKQVFVPAFMSFDIDYPAENIQRFLVRECFAHRGMEKAGVLKDYECGIFERIVGWLDAMNLTYSVSPDLSRCLKYKGRECEVTIRFHF